MKNTFYPLMQIYTLYFYHPKHVENKCNSVKIQQPSAELRNSELNNCPLQSLPTLPQSTVSRRLVWSPAGVRVQELQGMGLWSKRTPEIRSRGKAAGRGQVLVLASALIAR